MKRTFLFGTEVSKCKETQPFGTPNCPLPSRDQRTILNFYHRLKSKIPFSFEPRFGISKWSNLLWIFPIMTLLNRFNTLCNFDVIITLFQLTTSFDSLWNVNKKRIFSRNEQLRIDCKILFFERLEKIFFKIIDSIFSFRDWLI